MAAKDELALWRESLQRVSGVANGGSWHLCPVDADVWARQLLGIDLPPKCPPAQILKVAES